MSDSPNSSRTELFDLIMNTTSPKTKQTVDMATLIAEAHSSKRARVTTPPSKGHPEESAASTGAEPKPKVRLNLAVFRAMSHLDDEDTPTSPAEHVVEHQQNPTTPILADESAAGSKTPLAEEEGLRPPSPQGGASGQQGQGLPGQDVARSQGPPSPRSPSLHLSDLFSPDSQGTTPPSPNARTGDASAGKAALDGQGTATPVPPVPTASAPASGDNEGAAPKNVALPGEKELLARLEKMPPLPVVSDDAMWNVGRNMLAAARFHVNSSLVWARLEKRLHKDGSFWATVSLRWGPLTSSTVLSSTRLLHSDQENGLNQKAVVEVCQALAETLHFCNDMLKSLEPSTVDEDAVMCQFAQLARKAFKVTEARRSHTANVGAAKPEASAMGLGTVEPPKPEA